MQLLRASLCFGMLALASVGLADDQSATPLPARLVNLDTPAVTPRGVIGGRLDVRFFDHPEDIVYTSLGIRYGLYKNLEVGVRGVTGTTKNLAVPAGGVISHGGRDVELYGKYGFTLSDRTSLAGLVGVGFPSTPAQHRPILTLGGTGSFRMNNRVMLFLNPRGTMQEGNVTGGIGVGAQVQASPGLALVGDWTGIVDGENTRSVLDGSRIKRDVWGVALRWSSTGNGTDYALDLGFGNAAGSTTGFSLTPGLGNSSGFYFALIARR